MRYHSIPVVIATVIGGRCCHVVKACWIHPSRIIATDVGVTRPFSSVIGSPPPRLGHHYYRHCCESALDTTNWKIRISSTRTRKKVMTTMKTSTATTTDHASVYVPTQEWDVQRYQSQHAFVWQYGSSLLDLIQLGPGESVLDIGCGTGELTQELWQRQQQQGESKAQQHESKDKAVHNIWGMDADPAMIDTAKSQFPHLKFVVGDVRDFTPSHMMTMEDGDHSTHDTNDDSSCVGVDVIFSNAALHWVPPRDAPAAVACMTRALKPGSGRFVVEFGGKGNVEIITCGLNAALQQQGYTVPEPFWYFPNISEYTSLLEQNGMEVTMAALFDRPTVLQDGVSGLRNWIRMFGKEFLKYVPQTEECQEAFLAVVEDNVRSRLYDATNNQWTADYRRIRIVARKL